jgi:glutamyl-tRNA synthetase
MSRKVRVRFAPSPTGALHIGGVRTALFNYLFAQQHKGDFIIRIEDTDQTRFVEGAEQYIMDALAWCGINPVESPMQGGAFAPYRQSERKAIYAQYAMQLVEAGHAYYAFDTATELEAMRLRLKSAGVASPQYNSITRMQMKNSITLPADEVKRRLDEGEDYVIRLKMPRREEVRFKDMIRDWVSVSTDTLDDKVLLKSDGMPTYHLANIVDDYLMQITHVIRGEEWLPSAPTHVLLYRFLGWEKEMPEFAHLPLILKPDGNGKLSKRDGAAFNMPVFPLDWKSGDEFFAGFREWGFLPEAVVNFLALLGWNSGTNQEIYSMAELIEQFDIAKVNKAGARFDFEKAKWFNQQYLRRKPDAEIAAFLQSKLEAVGKKAEPHTLEHIAALLKERAVFMNDFWEDGQFFFFAPQGYDPDLVAKKWNADAQKGLETFLSALKTAEITWKAEPLKAFLQETLKAANVGLGKVMLPLRLALTGVGAGPDLMQILEILGKEETIQRLEVALEKLAV